MDGLNQYIVELSQTYSVNPLIFGVLYIGGIPLFLGVIAWLAKRARAKKPVTVQALLALYLAIQPYLYVAVFGENLPAWVWAVIIGMIGLGLWSTYRTVQKRKAEAALTTE